MLDEAQVSLRQDVLLDRRSIVEAVERASARLGTNPFRPTKRDSRNLLRIDDQPRMSRTEVSFQFRLDRSELAERGRDLAEDPGGREVREEEAD